jgi:phosphoribosyl-AMP cyclohydrolase / phosphoribosyl-ATP pyrophosphohydrolase
VTAVTGAPAADGLAWEKCGGLLPAVVQDADSGAVLMLGFMDREALARTVASGRATFWSRSRQRLWEKGETSGNTLEVLGVHADCDSDTLLLRVRPQGAVCHTGAADCFPGAAALPPAFLGHLARIVAERATAPVEQSYTARLLAEGMGRLAQKVGEEGVETALAAVGGDRQALLAESADLVYHLLVLLQGAGLSLTDLSRCLEERHR